MRDKAFLVATRAAGVLVLLFLLTPLVVVAGASLEPGSFLTFPPTGVSMRWYQEILSDPAWLTSFQLSLWLTVVATPVATVLGALAGYAIARWEYPGRDALTLFMLSPLMVAEVLMGLAFLYYLTAFRLVGSVTGLLLAYVLVGMPYVARTVAASLETLDPDLEIAAESLGASRWRQLRTVVLPHVMPGILAGATFAAVLAFGELAITLFIAGPATTTLAMRIYTNVQFAANPSVAAAATIVIVLAVLAVIVLERSGLATRGAGGGRADR